MGVEEFEQDADVFQAGVHALAVERDHGVRGVAEDDRAGSVMVRRACDADEGEVWVGCELLEQGFWRDEVG